MTSNSKLERALRVGDLRAIARLAQSEVRLERGREAHALGEALRSVTAFPRERVGSDRKDLHSLVALCQRCASRDAYDGVVRHVVPELCRLLDLALSADEVDDSLVLFVLKQLATFPTPAGTDRLLRSARATALREAYLWSVVFGILAEEGNSCAEVVLEGLREPLPDGFVGVAYLDFASALARADRVGAHPFDSPDGLERLRRYLRDQDPERFSRAHSAAGALPFLGAPARAELFALAADHPDSDVQLEAAWAAARLGGEAGLQVLARAALDPRTARRAIGYLEELGRADVVPAAASDPDHQAAAAIGSWLSHPMEFGAPPDELALYDTRLLYWPPTDDRRRVWLFRYRYEPGPRRATEAQGVGMVGSITFALFGRPTADLPAEDVYGLHCCWELQRAEDPRAPKDLDAALGWALIERGPEA